MRAVLKSTNRAAKGRKIVEDPKPAIVPTISEKRAVKKKPISIEAYYTKKTPRLDGVFFVCE